MKHLLTLVLAGLMIVALPGAAVAEDTVVVETEDGFSIGELPSFGEDDTLVFPAEEADAPEGMPEPAPAPTATPEPTPAETPVIETPTPTAETVAPTEENKLPVMPIAAGIVLCALAVFLLVRRRRAAGRQ